MVQGRAKLRVSGLGVGLTWDASQFVSLETKELGEQATNGPQMIFGKWINIKSRGSGLISYQTIITNELGFYSEDDT